MSIFGDVEETRMLIGYIRVSLVFQPGLGSLRKIDYSDSSLFEIKIIYLNENMF